MVKVGGILIMREREFVNLERAREVVAMFSQQQIEQLASGDYHVHKNPVRGKAQTDNPMQTIIEGGVVNE